MRACVCLSIVSVVSLRDQRALSNEPDRMTSHSVRSRRKSTNLPQRARARGARALPSLSLRPRRLLNYYSHLPLPLIKLARPAAAATAAASSRARGLHFDRLFQIQIDYHLERAASLTRARGSRRGEAAGEEQRVDGKINFPSEYCASPRSVGRRVDGRPTDGQLTEQNRQSPSFCCIFCRRLLRSGSGSRRSQWMSERTAMGGISQVAQPVHSQSQSLSGVLRCTFRPFLVLSILLPLLRSPLCDCSVTV